MKFPELFQIKKTCQILNTSIFQNNKQNLSQKSLLFSMFCSFFQQYYSESMIENEVVYEAEEEYEHIVCGAGLVGVLWALYLRRRSQSVAIFEKSADCREEIVWGGRSINMTITKKALDALEELGIKDYILSHTKPLEGKIIHLKGGQTVCVPYSNSHEDKVYCIQRMELNRLLLQIAENNNISVYFGYRFKQGDLDNNKFIFQNEDGKIAIRGNYLYGADGAGSEVRKNMHKYNQGSTKAEWLDLHYKELFVPTDENGQSQLDEKYLHIWPRGKQMMLGMPNPNGSFSLTLFLSAFGDQSFEQLNNEEKMRKYLMENFPDVFNFIPNPVEQIFSNPMGVLGTLYCSNWSYKDKCILLGDAAHTLLPFYSQAMNSGYHDCFVLDKLIDQHGFSGAFEKFEDVQKVHSDSMAKMAIDHYFDLSSRKLETHHILERRAELLLMQKFPGKFESRQHMILFGTNKYYDAFVIGEKNHTLLDELLKNVDKVENIDLNLARKLLQGKPREVPKYTPGMVLAPTRYYRQARDSY